HTVPAQYRHRFADVKMPSQNRLYHDFPITACQEAQRCEQVKKYQKVPGNVHLLEKDNVEHKENQVKQIAAEGSPVNGNKPLVLPHHVKPVQSRRYKPESVCHHQMAFVVSG